MFNVVQHETVKSYEFHHSVPQKIVINRSVKGQRVEHKLYSIIILSQRGSKSTFKSKNLVPKVNARFQVQSRDG